MTALDTTVCVDTFITHCNTTHILMSSSGNIFLLCVCFLAGLFDRDGNGKIDLQEFNSLWAYIQQWRGVFDRYDRDRSGNIDTQELHTAFNEMGYRVSPQFAQLVVTGFDRASRRSLKFDDFIQACVMLRGLTDAFRTRDTNLNGVIQVSYEDFMTMAVQFKP